MASQPIDTGKQTRYHWWYDNKAAGVRNPPGIGMQNNTPPSSPPGIDNSPRRFSFTSGLTSMTGTSPPSGADIPARPRRDSLKNMFHLSDFGTPGT